MASTNKTTHLRLNQWIASDPVLRTDFNLDNSKLDAAVQARSLVRLESGTLSASASKISFDLGDYDLTQFMELQIRLFPKTSSTSVSGGAMTSLAVNGAAAGSNLARMAADGTRGLIVHLCLLPGGLGGYYFVPGGTDSGGFSVAGVTAGDLISLELKCGDNASYLAGTRYALYGLAV